MTRLKNLAGRPGKLLAAAGLALMLAGCASTGGTSGTGAVIGGVGGGWAGYEVGRAVGGTPGAAIGTVIGLVGGVVLGNEAERMVTGYTGPSFGGQQAATYPVPAGGTNVQQDGTVFIDDQGRTWVAARGAQGYCVGEMNGTTWVPAGFDRNCRRNF